MSKEPRVAASLQFAKPSLLLKILAMSQFLYREWLPPPIAQEALNRESTLFGNLFRALAEDWEASRDLPSAERSQASLKWISLVNRCDNRCPVLNVLVARKAQAC